MGISQSELFLLVLYSAATGILLGLTYDAIRLVRYIFFSPNANSISENHRLISKAASGHPSQRVVLWAEWLFVSITDIIFMIMCAITVILVAYVENMGRMRWLILFGVSVGFVLYRFSIGKLVNRISIVTATLVRAVFIFIAKIFGRVMVKIKSVKIKKKTRKGRGKWHVRKKRDKDRITEL